MKHILIKLIKLYQIIPGNFHNYCRHIPTCSNYGIEAINEYGCLKGCALTLKRILKCNPWSSYGYDPVVKKENKNEKKNCNIYYYIVKCKLNRMFKKR